MGRPDRVHLIFERAITARTPGVFQTDVLQYGVMPSIRLHYKHSVLKQYLKDGRALRTEMMINNPYDFGRKRGLAQFDELVALGQAINARLLEHEQLSQDCFMGLESVRDLGRSTVTADGQRAAALRFGDPRILAVMAALTQWLHLPDGLTNKTLRASVAALLGVAEATYTSAQMSYDLRRLRLKGLVVRRPKSHTYVLTALGAKVAVFFTKLATRLFQPGLAAVMPDPRMPSPLAEALTVVADLIDGLMHEAHIAPAAA